MLYEITKVLKVAAIALCVSCTSQQIKISSSPEGANVISTNGQILGQTPLQLTAEQLPLVSVDGIARMSLSKSGYVTREVIFETFGATDYTFNLSPHDPKYFNSEVVSGFPKESNEMIRDYLRAHGYVIAGKFDDAEKILKSLQERYPQLAATYVMLANIALAKRDSETAKNLLLRAKSLDPLDPIANRMSESNSASSSGKAAP